MKENDIQRLRTAIGGITSAVHTLESLDGEEIDVENNFAMHAEHLRVVGEELAEIADQVEEESED